MFTLEVKKLSKVAALTLFAATSIFAANAKAVDGGVDYKVVKGTYAGVYKVNEKAESAKGLKYGRKPTANELKATKIAVRYDWEGLPEGKGKVSDGDALFEKHCSMCHGDMGTGGKGYPKLTGGDIDTLKNQLVDPEKGDEPPERSIGAYWPYASTLWWYIKTAMPFPHPMSLTNDEVYAITAYLLSVDEVQIGGEDLDDDYVLTKKKLMTLHMPNEKGFYPEVNGKNGVANMTKFLSDGKNYGTPTKRCMKNCPTGKVVHIKAKLDTGIIPPVTEKRDLPKETGKKESGSKFAKLYEANCNACHGNDAIAPKVGNKDSWAARIKQGTDTLYKHALGGYKGMPAKGGHADMKDADVKGIVDYMISKSK